MAMLLYGRTPGIDLARLLKMCLIHDLGEALGGDVPAPLQSAGAPKAGHERADLLELSDRSRPICAVRFSSYGTTTRRPALPKRSWPKGWTSWRPFCNTPRGKTHPTSITLSILPTGAVSAADPLLAAIRARLERRPFGALLLDPGGTKISSNVHDQLTHDSPYASSLSRTAIEGRLVRDVQLSHRTVCRRLERQRSRRCWSTATSR